MVNNMLCENCGKNHATTHIRTIINGKLCEKNLCDYCAALGGYSAVSDDPLSQMLFSMFGDSFVSTQKPSVTRCDCCGLTFDEIAKNGKCGCSKCYQVFYDELLPYIKRVHGSTRHVGKTPDKIYLTDSNEQTVEQLRRRLTELVSEEKYEEAAVIRDKIKKLEAQQQ